MLTLRFKLRYGRAGRKNKKKIYINEKIRLGKKEFSLQSAILHHDDSVEAGHYTSIVKVEKQWWAVDDSRWKKITDIKKTLKNIQGGKENCSYIVQYKSL